MADGRFPGALDRLLDHGTHSPLAPRPCPRLPRMDRADLRRPARYPVRCIAALADPAIGAGATSRVVSGELWLARTVRRGTMRGPGTSVPESAVSSHARRGDVHAPTSPKDNP